MRESTNDHKDVTENVTLFINVNLYKRVYGQFCTETLHERHNGIQRLVVCLSEYLPLSILSL